MGAVVRPSPPPIEPSPVGDVDGALVEFYQTAERSVAEMHRLLCDIVSSTRMSELAQPQGQLLLRAS